MAGFRGRRCSCEICPRCLIPGFPMKWILLIAVVLVFVISLVADYKWRQWMAERKRDRQ